MMDTLSELKATVAQYKVNYIVDSMQKLMQSVDAEDKKLLHDDLEKLSAFLNDL